VSTAPSVSTCRLVRSLHGSPLLQPAHSSWCVLRLALSLIPQLHSPPRRSARRVALVQVLALAAWLLARDPTAVVPPGLATVRSMLYETLLSDRVIAARVVYAAVVAGLATRSRKNGASCSWSLADAQS